ncbi:unnamed protein product [Arabis nemorensis]|uniref:Uncharacterized protein n=1 Tax=Arabis nemorensis TaxID=586526 RepID=A0A565AV87_9BRAS|nr:unnamed protein product [Arabis nemorensis]
MDPIEKKRDLTTSETASPLSKMDLKKQNDVTMFLAEKVISTVARNTNFTMVASTTEDERVRSLILFVLRSSSIDGSANGGPKISSVNGVWIE